MLVTFGGPIVLEDFSSAATFCGKDGCQATESEPDVSSLNAAGPLLAVVTPACCAPAAPGRVAACQTFARAVGAVCFCCRNCPGHICRVPQFSTPLWRPRFVDLSLGGTLVGPKILIEVFFVPATSADLGTRDAHLCSDNKSRAALPTQVTSDLPLYQNMPCL